MRSPLQVFVGSLALMAAAGLVGAVDSPELRRYIDEARVWGMGEAARITLRTVASITTGGTTLSFAKEPGGEGYSRSYQSTSCPPRGADSLALQEWKKTVSARIDPEVQALRAIADADTSGFVTSPEASACRELIEFGYFVAFLTSGGSISVSEIARATQVAEGELSARIEKYNDAAARLNARRRGPLEPRLPLVRLGT